MDLWRLIALAAGPPLASAYIRLLGRTMRIERRGHEILEASRSEAGGYILAFWHARFLLMPYAYPREHPMTAMLSRHADAELLARTLSRFGVGFVRGSTTRGGSAALRELVRRVRAGSNAGLAPDGPRGPRRRAQLGVVLLAAMTGRPIVPVAFSAWPARRLRTWDRAVVPRLFSRGLFLYGEPLRVAREASEATREALRQELQARLDDLTDAADRETGLGPEPPAEGSLP